MKQTTTELSLISPSTPSIVPLHPLYYDSIESLPGDQRQHLCPKMRGTACDVLCRPSLERGFGPLAPRVTAPFGPQ